MAIEITGQKEGAEYEAAADLREKLSGRFRREDQIVIVAGAKCHGQKRQDLDLVVLGNLNRGFRLETGHLPDDLRDRPAYLSDFALIIEVKDSDPRDVRISAANQVEVRYKESWHNASTQLHEQIYSARALFKSHDIRSPWWATAVWLRNVPSSQLPKGDHNILTSDSSADDLIRLLVYQRGDRLRQQQARDLRYYDVYSCQRGKVDGVQSALKLFQKTIRPTRLDRKRLELICQQILKNQRYAERLGSQLLLFRGRGGSGKTINLLRIATNLHDDSDARVLFLTYNKALVADVRRLFAILGVGDRIGQRTISIQTSDSYLFALLNAWGMNPERGAKERFPADYVPKKRELLALLRGTGRQELRSDPIWSEYPAVFQWDYILVDEGQDWPEEDRDLVYALFGPERTIVADGVDQFVRRRIRCDWTSSSAVPVTERQIVPLRRSLRLKSNLCRFAESFASEMGVPWEMEINDEVAGGKVVILRGAYTKELHSRLMRGHKSAGNEPVDALFCATGTADAPSKSLPATLLQWGERVWDGTTAEGREAYPTDVRQFRIVKYESCRGLEGWTVVCLDLDLFYDRKLSEGKSEERELFQSREEVGKQFAGRWCLIPMTRAIDTLVLQVAHGSEFAGLLASLADGHSDFVELIDTSEPLLRSNPEREEG